GAVYNSNERQPHSVCLQGTRVELLQSLQAHLNDRNRKLLWVTGESGCGKSTIAHTLAEKLDRQGRLAATFFFSRKHAKRSNLDHVFVSLAYQLGLHHPRAQDIIVQAISNDPSLL
ncbi:hypothetical protein CONPUDRAFT_24349, partial [Coniophora puteana RWD-64-598 SS2]